MPSPYLQKLSKEKNIPIKELEKKWDEAKKLAKDEDHEGEWDYVTAIFKKLAKVEESYVKEEWYDNLKYSTSYMRGLANVHGLNDPEEMPLVIKNNRVQRKIMWNIMKYLTAPIETLPAYKNGLIDEDGRPTGQNPTGKESRTYNSFVKLILALRRSLLKLVPKQRLALAVQKLFLLREGDEFADINKDFIYILETTSSGDIATLGAGEVPMITDEDLLKLIKKLKNKGVIKNIKDYLDKVV